LDKILKRRAEAGVKIYVVVYKEVEAAITCNSRHTKHSLEALCPEGTPGHGNIKCMRHPDHNVLENASDMTFYWAHHEKFIVIDYQVAFIGGLDLCFGRWDAHQHTMADIHPAGVENEIFPGQDFNNNRIMDFHSVEDWSKNQLSKAENGRMPWHDISFGLIGPSVYDIAEHFVLRWNFVKRDKYKRKDTYPWLTLEGREGADEDLVGVQRPKFPEGGYIHHPLSPLSGKNLDNRGSVKAQLVRSSTDWSSGILTEHSIMNAYCELITNAEHFVYIENQFFITATGEEQAPIRNTIGRAIVDAVVKAGKENRKFRVIIVIPAIPGFAGDLRQDAATGTRAIMDYQYKSILRGEHSIYEQIKAQGVDPTKHIYIFNLRSYDRLNTTPAVKEAEKKAGVGYVEIQNAEAEEIMGESTNSAISDKAQKIDKKIRSHSISSDKSGKIEPEKPEEKKADEAAEKPAERAETEKTDAQKKFDEQRGEEGLGGDAKEDHTTPTANTIGQNAMLNTPNVVDEKWHDGHEDLERENIVQEELYIHAKLLIVDDRFVVCGSSNINDRSQIGIHDSELSIVLEDTKKLASKMDGKDFEANHLAATLRRRLWREHLGLLPPQDLDGSDDPNAQPPGDGVNNNDEGEEYEFVADPLSDKLWETWTSQASTNTDVFRDIFHADPDNTSKL
jgi:phospholipase D1/2